MGRDKDFRKAEVIRITELQSDSAPDGTSDFHFKRPEPEYAR